MDNTTSKKEWNRKGKRKRLICFTIADIANARGVENAAVHKAKERGFLDLDDIESVARYVLFSGKKVESGSEKEKPVLEEEKAEFKSTGVNLSQIMQKAKAKKFKAEIKETKLDIGKEIIGYIKDNVECPSEIWKRMRDFDIPEWKVPDDRLCIGNINPQEMKFKDLDYEKKWALIWTPLYGEEQPN